MTITKSFFILTLTILTLSGTRGSASPMAPSPNGGIWFRDGSTYGNAPRLGADDASVIASIPGHYGYWAISNEGKVYARGDAPLVCGPSEGDSLKSCSAYNGKPVVGVTANPDGKGFWVLDIMGHVWAVGSSKSYGDGAKEISISVRPIEILATPSGKGYYIMFTDGGVFTFGDAKFWGSTKSSVHFLSAALSYDATGAVNGYWMVKHDGGVFSFGNAVFLGSSGGNDGKTGDCDGIASFPNGRGYVWSCPRKYPQPDAVSWSRQILRAQLVAHTPHVSAAVADDSDAQEAPVVAGVVESDGDSNGNQWDVFPISSSDDGELRDGGVVQLVNVHSRMCMNVSGRTSEIIQWPCQSPQGSVTNDRWIMRFSDNTWTIHPVDKPELSLAPESAELGAAIALVDSGATADNRWAVNDVDRHFRNLVVEEGEEHCRHWVYAPAAHR